MLKSLPLESMGYKMFTFFCFILIALIIFLHIEIVLWNILIIKKLIGRLDYVYWSCLNKPPKENPLLYIFSDLKL